VTRPRRLSVPVRCAALLALVGLAGCGAADSTAVAAADTAVAREDPALHAMLPPEVAAAGVLTVGTDASYAPASSFAADGRTVVGFEPDLLDGLGRVLGVRVQLATQPFDGLVDAVAAHRVDLAVSAMTDTPERQRTVDFVDYFTAGTSIVVRRGNPHGVLELRDLCGQDVAVERGTVQVDLLRRSQQRCGSARIHVHVYPDNAQALLQLRTGHVTAVLNDYPPAAELAGGARTRAFYQLAADTQYEPGLYGVAVAKDRPVLRDAVHGAFERLLASGEYDRVLRQWEVERGSVSEPTVNGSTAP
jgi:polar amino acid transport system substrate-binding protein